MTLLLGLTWNYLKCRLLNFFLVKHIIHWRGFIKKKFSVFRYYTFTISYYFSFFWPPFRYDYTMFLASLIPSRLSGLAWLGMAWQVSGFVRPELIVCTHCCPAKATAEDIILPFAAKEVSTVHPRPPPLVVIHWTLWPYSPEIMF